MAVSEGITIAARLVEALAAASAFGG